VNCEGMFENWRLARRPGLAGPPRVKAGPYGRLIRSWLIVVFWLFGCNSALGQGIEYSLGTGDLLRVTVFGHEDLSGEFEVDSAGRVSLPLVGDLLVVNQTLDKVEDQIIAVLRPNYLKNPQVSVEIINYRPFYIIGEVANPGSYPYVGGMRVINAVAIAGGFTYRAAEDALLITRAKGDGQQESAGQGAPVFPGDVIEVPERFF
jgi:protein involved in polysaccharide export with SLBB domain